MNGDGVPDLLVSNQCNYGVNNCANLVVLLGKGDGSFQPPTSVTAPPSGGGLVLADFNGDGKLDIACSTANFLLLGNGDGRFQSPLILGAGGAGIAVGDFNLDGRSDLAVGGVTVLLNSGATLYTRTTTALTASPNPSTYGQSVTLTAVVSAVGGGNPTGTVSFFFNSVEGGRRHARQWECEPHRFCADGWVVLHHCILPRGFQLQRQHFVSGDADCQQSIHLDSTCGVTEHIYFWSVGYDHGRGYIYYGSPGRYGDLLRRRDDTGNSITEQLRTGYTKHFQPYCGRSQHHCLLCGE